MPRPVRIVALAVSESETLKDILALNPLNTVKWRNTRGRYRDRAGNWITYGLGPNGASDIIGARIIRITPEMVGARFAQFLAIEVKKEGEQPRDDQQAFIDDIRAMGGCAGVCWSVADAAALLLDIEALKRKSAA